MSATKELHEKLRNFVDNTDPLVALKHLDNIDNQLREQTKLTSYCLLYTSPSPRDRTRSRMPSSA